MFDLLEMRIKRYIFNVNSQSYGLTVFNVMVSCTHFYRRLLAQLESFKQSGISSPDKPSKSKSTSGDVGKSGVITYELAYRPEHANLAQVSRVADLENRLHKLETVVGATSDKMVFMCFILCDVSHSSF